MLMTFYMESLSPQSVSRISKIVGWRHLASKKPSSSALLRVIDHKTGLLRTRVVGEKRSREESGGVIEDGDVRSGSSVDQGRGSQECDTAGGGGGDVGEDREV